jgi:hypothetical protein
MLDAAAIREIKVRHSHEMLDRVVKAKERGEIKSFMIFARADDPEIIEYIKIER